MTSPAQAQGFDLATATKWTSELLGDFCDTADFSLGFVPDAALLIPPAQNFFVDHHELVEPPQSNSAADAFATVPETSGNAEEVTAAPLRRCLALRCSPSVYVSPRIRPRATGGGLGLQWPGRRRAMRKPRAFVRHLEH